MIFLSSKDNTRSYTMIHNVFFEQIMPLIDTKYLKVYLYAYYLSLNKDQVGEKTYTQIAAKLGMEDTELLSAWDYLEKISLIKKHHIDTSTSDNYHIEILPIDRYNTKKVKPTPEQQYIMQKNEKLKDMYDKIEQVTKLCLNPYEIKKIDAVIKNYDVAYEVVIEAFKYVYYQKKTNNVNDALDTLKQWIKDGIYTTKDLDTSIAHIETRYNMYRQILGYLGEYRIASKPEQETMDRWLDEYNFSLEVIKKAIDETLKTKSPNFRYIEGIMKNWHETCEKYLDKNKFDEKGYVEFKKEMNKYLDIKNIDTLDEKCLKFLYKNYPEHTIISAIKYVKTGSQELKIKKLYEFILSQNKNTKANIETYGAITLEQLEKAQKKKAAVENVQKTPYKKTQNRQTPAAQTQNPQDEEFEKFILSKNKLSDI